MKQLTQKEQQLMHWYISDQATYENAGTKDRSFDVPVTQKEYENIQERIGELETAQKSNQTAEMQTKMATEEASLKSKKDSLS